MEGRLGPRGWVSKSLKSQSRDVVGGQVPALAAPSSRIIDLIDLQLRFLNSDDQFLEHDSANFIMYGHGAYHVVQRQQNSLLYNQLLLQIEVLHTRIYYILYAIAVDAAKLPNSLPP